MDFNTLSFSEVQVQLKFRNVDQYLNQQLKLSDIIRKCSIGPIDLTQLRTVLKRNKLSKNLTPKKVLCVKKISIKYKYTDKASSKKYMYSQRQNDFFTFTQEEITC